jgi:hypothetical protein
MGRMKSPQYRYEQMLFKLIEDDEMLTAICRDNEYAMETLSVQLNSRILYFRAKRNNEQSAADRKKEKI